LGAADKSKNSRACIMIFNPRRTQPARHVRHEAGCTGGNSRALQADSHQQSDIQISEILPLHAKLADKFSLVRSCYHTAAAVHDTGHQMMQTGRLFTGGVNTPHAGCALHYLQGRGSELPTHVILPEPMGPTGGNMPHGQDADSWGRILIRSC